MNNIFKILFFAVILVGGNVGYSQVIDSSYEVGTWPGFRHAAISYTFDDGCSNQFAIAIPMFNEFDFKLTLFIVTDWDPNWADLQKAASQGHEVASHTITHPYLNQIDIEQQKIELESSKEIINANIKNNQCLTLAYPYCRAGDESLCKKYYIAIRACQGFVEKSTPNDFLNISSIICGNLGALKTTEDFSKKFEDTKKSNGWCVLLFHGIDDDGGYSPIPSKTLRESLEYLDARRDTFWVATFVNAVRYIKERDNVSIREISNQEGRITLQVTDSLDDTIYNYPLTLRRELPDGWESADASQDNKAIKTSTVEVDSKKYVMFDVVPDSGDIVITKG